MSYSFQNPSAEVIESYLKSAKTIAIVGLSHRKEAASYQVAHFLQAAGYRIIPVNPKLEGQELLGEHVMLILKISHFRLILLMYLDEVSFYQMLLMIFLRQMQKFFGVKLVLRMRRLRLFFVKRIDRIL